MSQARAMAELLAGKAEPRNETEQQLVAAATLEMRDHFDRFVVERLIDLLVQELQETDVLASAITAAGGIVGTRELSKRWKLKRADVLAVVGEPTFPEPLAMIDGRPAYALRDCEAWRIGRADA